MKRTVIFDFNRTLYEPDSGALFDGVPEMLEELKSEREMILYSKKEGGRDDLVEHLGISPYFKSVYFIEKKTTESVQDILQEHGLSTADALIVGDLITSELAAGHGAGIDTIWVRQGKFADVEGDFQPTHTVQNLTELRTLLGLIA